MPYPSETWISAFTSTLQIVADELRAYYAQMTGFLNTEHNEDGSHADVTADSLDVSGPGSFDENVTADADGSLPVAIGQVGTAPAGGLDIGGKWRIVAALSTSPGSGADYELQLWDLTNETAGPVLRVVYDSVDVILMAGAGSTKAWKLGTSSARVKELNVLTANVITALNLGGNPVGTRQTLAYTDTNFTGNVAGNADWVVDDPDEVISYSRTGDQATFNFFVAASDVANSPTQLRIATGLTAAVRCDGVCTLVDAGGAAVQAQAFISAGGTTINIEKNGGAAFTNTAGDNTNVVGQITFWV